MKESITPLLLVLSINCFVLSFGCQNKWGGISLILNFVGVAAAMTFVSRIEKK